MMMTPSLRSILGLLAFVASFSSAAAAPFTACVVEGNAPFSSRDAGAKGIDVDVLQAIAARIGRDLQFNWITVAARGGLGRALKQSIQSGGCDLFAGLPVTDGGGEDLAERGLAASVSYVSIGYALVVPDASAVRSMADVRRLKVGAVTATPADLYLRAGGYNRTPYGNASQLLAAVANGELGAGLIWAGRLAEVPLSAGLAVRQVLTDASLTTRFVLARRSGDSALGEAVDEAISALQADGTLGAIARRAGLP